MSVASIPESGRLNLDRREAESMVPSVLNNGARKFLCSDCVVASANIKTSATNAVTGEMMQFVNQTIFNAANYLLF